MKKFFYRSDDGPIEGPLRADILRAKVSTGKLPIEVLVCEEGADIWTPFIEFPGIEFPPELLEEEQSIFNAILNHDGGMEYVEPDLSPSD